MRFLGPMAAIVAAALILAVALIRLGLVPPDLALMVGPLFLPALLLLCALASAAFMRWAWNRGLAR